jgi:hypothetical protein
MSIKQFNGEWVAQEDRVLFRFNTHTGEGYAFWLTRVIVQGLIQGSQHLGFHRLAQEHSPEVAQALTAFEAQTAKQQANFTQTYEGAKQAPMGELPILVVGLKMTQENEQTTVDLQLVDQRNIAMHLPQPMLLILITLLDKLQESAKWGVGLEQSPSLLEETPTQPPLHLH